MGVKLTPMKVYIMAFQIKFYTLSKRDNSTKRPASDAGVLYNCVLKHGSGIMKPSISIDFGITNDPSQYNYCYIPVFDRYYFIQEWYFEDALWTATLKIDVLATYKTEIGNSSLYITRAAGAHNGDIIDTLYPVKSGCSFDSTTVNNPWWNSISWIVGVVSKAGNMGSMAYYGMSSSAIITMCENLLDATTIISEENGFSLDDASQALQLSLVDPMQYIKSCMALPVSMNDISNIGSAARVYAFNWDSGANGYKVYQAPYINKSFSFSIKKHPDTSTRGNYVNTAPFTKITLVIPPWGAIDIDTSITCNASTVNADVKIDPITGKAILTIRCNDIVLNRVEAQLGVPISLSSVTRDYVGTATGIANVIGGGIAGAVSGGGFGAILGAASGIGNAVSSAIPRANTIGTTGGFASAMGSFRLDHQFFRPIPDDNTHNGRPLCEVRRINTLSGYMLIQDGDVAINGTSAEDAEIRQYLESGFYYE